MSMGRFSAVVAALVAVTLIASGARAQPATPDVAPFAVEPADCTMEPRPINELRTLAEEGLAARAASPVGAATPEAGADLRRSRDPLDGVDVAAVTETVRQFVACSNAGNLPALSALTVDEVVRRQLAGIVLFMTQATGGAPTPANADPAILDAFFAAIAFPISEPEDEQLSLLAVEDVVAYEGGFVSASVTLRTPGAVPEVRESIVVLQDVGGQYRVFSDSSSSSGTDLATGTPVA